MARIQIPNILNIISCYIARLNSGILRTFKTNSANDKVGCILVMVVVSILPHVEFGPNDNRETAPHFTSI